MKKQRLCMMLGSLALIGVVGVGSTLSYFSKASNEVKNTFTFGKNISITLQENKVNVDGTKKDEVFKDNEVNENNKGLIYDLKVGIDYNKNPHVVVNKDSNEAYIYMSVEGLDDFLEQDVDDDGKSDTYVKGSVENNVINSSWKKVKDLNGTTNTETIYDGIYVYIGNSNSDPVKVQATKSTTSLFETIGIKDSVTNLREISCNIKVQAAGVQTTNENYEQQAIDLLKKQNS